MKASQTKSIHASILTAMLGKTICFSGKFERFHQDRLHRMTEAQQGVVTLELDASVHFLVLPDPGQGKTVQKKAASLNAKGATIQVITGDDFLRLVTPTTEQVIALIRGGTSQADLLAKAISASPIIRLGGSASPTQTITSENFDQNDLSGFNFAGIAFDQCSFKACIVNQTAFGEATGCDFSGTSGASPRFFRCTRSLWRDSRLNEPIFVGSLADNDFTRAQFTKPGFNADHWSRVQTLVNTSRGQPRQAGISAVFSNASLPNATFAAVHFKSADFDHADLTNAAVHQCIFESSSFRMANLTDASLVDCKMPGAVLTGATLQHANFAGTDLSAARVDGADVQSINLLGARTNGVDFSRAKNYQTTPTNTAVTGPALTELDALCGTARQISVSLRIQSADASQMHEVGVDSRGLRWGNALRLPPDLVRRGHRHQRGGSFSLALQQLAAIIPAGKVQFGTIEASSSKSPKVGNALRELMINAVSEAFGQPVPPADQLTAATRTFREETREQAAVDREQREAAKKLAEKQQQTARKQIARQIEKQVGKVTDIATFLKALELRADKSKIDKATKMLKAEKFQLFNDITETHLNGVVKSQTDADLVYACRIESGGGYACCTQNLNICGGLRGSICKHLLVLIIGLVKAGQLDPSSIDTWIAKSHDAKPELNKETMGEIFIRYKGAEAGEVDWRPTETVPEDYYAV